MLFCAMCGLRQLSHVVSSLPPTPVSLTLPGKLLFAQVIDGYADPDNDIYAAPGDESGSETND
jgi:hypothetical protein